MDDEKTVQSDIPDETPLVTAPDIPDETPLAAASDVPDETPLAAAPDVPDETPLVTAPDVPDETPLAAAPDVPAKPSAKQPIYKRNTALRVFGDIANFLLIITLFGIVTALCAVLACRGIVSREGIEKIFTEINIKTITVGAFIPAEDMSDSDIELDEDDTLSDVVYKYIEPFAGDDFTKEQVDELIDESTVEEFFSDKMAQYMSLLTGNATKVSIDRSEIVSLVKENAALIKDATGYELSDGDYAEIEKFFSENNVEEKLTMTREKVVEVIRKENVNIDERTLDLIFTVISTTTVTLLTVTALLLIGLIFVCSLFRLGMTLCFTGGVTLAAGSIFAIIPFAVSMLLQFIRNDVDVSHIDFQLAERLIHSVASRAGEIGVYFVIAGILLIAGGITAAVLRRPRK